MRDAVVQHPAAGLEHLGDALRVRVDLPDAHMFDHADARDGIEALLAQVAVVHHADLDAAAYARLLRALARELRLWLRQRDAPDRRPVLPHGVDREASPAAADVEHAHAGFELELPADELELGPLGVLERLRSLLPQRAAVGH